MDRQAYLSDLLKQRKTTVDQANIQFLKKYLLLVGMGELRINGQAPNREFALADYVLDDYRTLIDWSRLSRKQEEKLKKWLFVKEQSCFNTRLFSPYRISEIRGRPEEVRVGFWARLYQTLFFQRRYYKIPFDPDFIPDTYALKDINIALSRQGALIDLVPSVQILSKETLKSAREYQDSGQQNVKRLILTDDIVEKILSTECADYDFDELLTKPHAHAITTHHPDRRLYRMREYRRDNQYHNRPTLFVRLFRFVTNWFKGVLHQTLPKRTYPDFTEICSIDDKKIYIEKIGQPEERRINASGEVYLTEPRPPVNVFVFSGGGAKIFGHVGAVKIANQHDINATIFAGSSSGAIIAMLLYVGYMPEEIEEEFDYIKDDILIDVDVKRAGISTTRNLKSAINYMVLNKIRKIVRQYQQRFQEGPGAIFLEKYFNESTFTFKALEMLSRICPEAGVGEALFVTGSDVTAQERKIFSLETTPDMEIAEAVKISGSMPVLYHPTDLDGHDFTDGGCMENTPLGLERLFKKTKTLIEHESAANLNVLAFQFDNGVETDVIHSAKPVFRENYFINKIYEFASGVIDPASWWVRERRGLRKYACQTIIIKTAGVKAAKFSIGEDVRHKLIGLGESGAIDYIGPRFLAEENAKPEAEGERLYKRFENLEELIYYCAYRQEWDFLNKLMADISDPRKGFDKTYLGELQSLKWRLLEEEKRQQQHLRVKKTAEAKYKPLFSEVSHRVDDAHEQAGLFCLLYSLLVCNWEGIAQSDRSGHLSSSIVKLMLFRKSLIRNKQKGVFITFTEMCQYFEEMNSETHILLYMLKVLLMHVQNAPISDIEESLKGLRQIMSKLSDFNTVPDKSSIIGDWCFGIEKTRALISFLNGSSGNKMERMCEITSQKGYRRAKQFGDKAKEQLEASNEGSMSTGLASTHVFA